MITVLKCLIHAIVIFILKAFSAFHSKFLFIFYLLFLLTIFVHCHNKYFTMTQSNILSRHNKAGFTMTDKKKLGAFCYYFC